MAEQKSSECLFDRRTNKLRIVVNSDVIINKRVDPKVVLGADFELKDADEIMMTEVSPFNFENGGTVIFKGTSVKITVSGAEDEETESDDDAGSAHQWLPPKGESNVSNINLDDWKVRDAKSGSVADFFQLVQIAKYAYSENPSASAQKAAKALLSQFTQNDLIGVLCERNSPTELTHTALFTALLQEYLGSDSLFWVHQVELQGAKADSVLIEKTEHGSVPIGVIENGMSGANDKISQLFGYGVNMSALLSNGIFPFFLGAIIKKDGNVSLRGFFAALKGEDSVLADIEIFSAPLKQGLAIVLDCFGYFATLPKLTQPIVWREHKRTPNNVLLCGDSVYKVFDYRNKDIAKSQRRAPDVYFELYGDEVRYEVKSEDFSIITYLQRKGDHCLRNTTQAKVLIKILRGYHEKGVILGDIRLRNCVFSEDGTNAHFIDFDFSKMRDQNKNYPLGWNLRIEDGARARDVAGGGEMKQIHDWEALSAMFGLFESVQSEKQQKWKSLVQEIKRGHHEAAASLEDFNLKVRKRKVIPGVWVGGSGLPERPRAKLHKTQKMSSRRRNRLSYSSFHSPPFPSY